MSQITLPTYYQNAFFTGDIDVLNGLNVDNGDGTVYVRNGGLYVNGLTNLNETTIVTNSGVCTVEGSNGLNVNVTNYVQLAAAANSYFTNSSGYLNLQATDTTGGKMLIQGSGTGPNTVKIYTDNATSSQINIQSAGGSTTVPPILIQSTDTSNGRINLVAAGNYASSNPAITLQASNSTSGQIYLSGSGASGTTPAIYMNTPNGNFEVLAAGDYTSNVPAVWLKASNTTGGKVVVEASGTAADSIWLHSNNGGVKIDGTGEVLINTTDTTNGVVIASTSMVPVVIGSAGSLTTINGNLDIVGTTTTINTTTLTVDNNVVILNSGTAVSNVDAGLAIRRYQTANNTPTGDVITTPSPVQESGAFQAGSATPGTLVLAAYASSTDNYYGGWWIEVTSGTGINQVRRIKSYNGTTKTVTLYVTADNTTQPSFTDGLDLVTAPAAGDTYRMYNSSYITLFYNESDNIYSFYTVANADISGITTTDIQQPQAIGAGSLSCIPQTYNNAAVSASGTTLTVTLMGHGLSIGQLVGITNSAGLTPSLASGNYQIVTVVDVNNFTITAAASTTSASNSSVSVSILNSSVVKANVIEPYTPGIPISIPGFTSSENITIPKTSTSLFSLSNTTTTYGSYIILVSDLNNTNGAYAVFSATSAGSNGTVTRIAVSTGADGQRINATWTTGNPVQIRQSPAGTGTGNYVYVVRVFSGL